MKAEFAGYITSAILMLASRVSLLIILNIYLPNNTLLGQFLRLLYKRTTISIVASLYPIVHNFVLSRKGTQSVSVYNNFTFRISSFPCITISAHPYLLFLKHDMSINVYTFLSFRKGTHTTSLTIFISLYYYECTHFLLSRNGPQFVSV